MVMSLILDEDVIPDIWTDTSQLSEKHDLGTEMTLQVEIVIPSKLKEYILSAGYPAGHQGIREDVSALQEFIFQNE